MQVVVLAGSQMLCGPKLSWAKEQPRLDNLSLNNCGEQEVESRYVASGLSRHWELGLNILFLGKVGYSYIFLY